MLQDEKPHKCHKRITFLVNVWLSYKPSVVDSQSLGEGDIASMSLKRLPTSLNFSHPLETSRLLKNGTGATSSEKSFLEWDIVGENSPLKVSIERVPSLDSLPINTSSFILDVPCRVSKHEVGSCGAIHHD